MLSPGWTEVYINALQVRLHVAVDFVCDTISALTVEFVYKFLCINQLQCSNHSSVYPE